tara:strand:+ start:79 stop:300 length:222 start_codon:yes stop_codon:yes gene_type:complete
MFNTIHSENLTRTEAKEKALAGLKISHRYFSDNEFVQGKNGKLIDENGYILDWFEFWQIRSTPQFAVDWFQVE